jgi:alginate O-acetyltransferase complex protein AlgI
LIQSHIFWLVLLGALAVFWALPARYRYGFLTLVSIGYLASLDLRSVAMLLVLTVVFYFATPHMTPSASRAKRWTVAMVLLVCGVLAVFKYVPPIIDNIIKGRLEAFILIPLGLSYYAFKLIHYAVEVYHGTIQRGRLDDFALYLFLFPIFTAGPIERYDHFITHREPRLSRDAFVDGGSRIIIGVIKQAVIAQMLLDFVVPSIGQSNEFMRSLARMSTMDIWLVLLRTYLYVYISFSAYSDVAIGASRLFGLRIQENFNFPIFARNLSDFWQRWHMTLSRWCQTYVYLPVLGRTRNPYIALHLSFFVMGIWHSGTWVRVAWGLYHAWGVIAYVLWSRLCKRKKWEFLNRGPWVVLAILITQIYVLGSWALLVEEGDWKEGLRDGVRVLAQMFFLDV